MNLHRLVEGAADAQVVGRQEEQLSQPLRRLLRPLCFGLAVAAAVWVYWGLGLPRYMSVEGMRALVDSHAPYGPLIFMAMVVAGICTQVPMMGTLLIAVGGVVFSGLPAFVYAWVASLAGTTPTFLLARYVAREPVQRVLYVRYAWLRALDERLARHGFRTVFALRLVGVLAPPLNWGLGLTGVRVQHYIAGTALVPGIAIIVFFADSIASRPSGSRLSLVVILRGVSLVAFGGPMLMGLSRRRRETGDTSGEAAAVCPSPPTSPASACSSLS